MERKEGWLEGYKGTVFVVRPIVALAALDTVAVVADVAKVPSFAPWRGAKPWA